MLYASFYPHLEPTSARYESLVDYSRVTGADFPESMLTDVPRSTLDFFEIITVNIRNYVLVRLSNLSGNRLKTTLFHSSIGLIMVIRPPALV